MSIVIDIYSEVYDKYKSMYADYSPLLKTLPAKKYILPDDTEIKNPFFQGRVVVEDLEFMRAVIGQLDVAVQVDMPAYDTPADLTMIILDAIPNDELDDEDDEYDEDE